MLRGGPITLKRQFGMRVSDGVGRITRVATFELADMIVIKRHSAFFNRRIASARIRFTAQGSF